MPGLSLIDSLRKRAAIADGVPVPPVSVVIAAPAPVVAPTSPAIVAPEINPPESKNAGPPLPPVGIQNVTIKVDVKAEPEPSPADVDIQASSSLSEQTLTGDEAKAVRAEIAKVVEETKSARKARAPKAEPAPAAEPAPPRATGYTLFVDCLPTKSQAGGVRVTSAAALAELARPIVQENSKSQDCPDGLSDYRFASFGQGPGMLVLAVRSLLATEAVADKVHVDTRTPEGAILLGLLSAHAREIVQAIR